MIYFWSVLFGVLVGAVCFAAAYYARRRPVMKLFGRSVQTERVMDIVVLAFLLVIIFIRYYFIPGDWQRIFWKGALATLCVLVPAALVMWLGYALILRKKYPVAAEEKEEDIRK
jgi:amino acid permease